MYISTTDELIDFCWRASRFDAIAVDTEFLREKTYRAKLCLIQIATPEEYVCIDPLVLDDLEPLRDLFTNRGVTKVFHACSQDMEVLFDALGCLPKPIFDTQIAASFLGFRMQIGYSSLVSHYCGVNLSKMESLTDWSQRPLTPEQIEYAYDDVRYLIQFYRQMYRDLEDKDRLSWVSAEMVELTRKENYEVDRREVFRRVKRITSLTRHQQGVARELAAWRELRAQKCDIPRKWVMTDEVLIAICKREPRNTQDLCRIRGTESLSARDCEGVLTAVAHGLACPPDRLPLIRKPHKAAGPELDSVSDLMYALVRLVSEREGIATAMIASRESLIDYIVKPQSSVLSEGWRHELVGRQLDDLLAGRIGLTVHDNHVELV